jgi:hypothetical protein
MRLGLFVCLFVCGRKVGLYWMKHRHTWREGGIYCQWFRGVRLGTVGSREQVYSSS